MTTHKFAIAAIALLSATLTIVSFRSSAAGDSRQKHPQEGTMVRFCGIVVKLVESGCIGLNPDTGAEPFNITAVRPKPPLGAIIKGSGRVHYVYSICMQGIPLTDVTWKKAAACPQGGKEK